MFDRIAGRDLLAPPPSLTAAMGGGGSSTHLGQAMRGYSYTLFYGDGRVGAALTLHLSSDDAACELANEMLSKSEFAALEMRRDAELIYQIGRIDADAAKGGLSVAIPYHSGVTGRSKLIPNIGPVDY